MALQFQEEPLGQFSGGGVEGLTDVRTAQALLIIQLYIFQETIGHSFQSILWPRLKQSSSSYLVLKKRPIILFF